MKQVLSIFCVLFYSFFSFALSDIDLAVREVIYEELSDGESCFDFYDDIFSVFLYNDPQPPCDHEVRATVRLFSCFDKNSQPYLLETLVCLQRTPDMGLTGTLIETWRP